MRAATLLLVLAACKDARPTPEPPHTGSGTAGVPTDQAATTSAMTATATVLPGGGGTIWFITEGPPNKLVRLARGVRTDLASDVVPSASVLADGRLVAIASRGDGSATAEQLVLVGTDGAITKLGPAGRQIRDPAVDPNGKWIVIAADVDGHSELQRIDLDTGVATRLTNDPQGNSRPAALVGPGDPIVFVSSRDGDSEIYRGSAMGGAVQRLTAVHEDDRDPTPSPDGKTIAFLSDREGPTRIFLMKPDGSGQRRLTERTDLERRETQLAWSPDGTLIAYVIERGQRWHLWVRDVAAAQEHDLTPEGVLDREPSFSPDGKWIVVSRTQGHDIDLWAIPTGVGEPVRLTSERTIDRLPRWR